jgi:hypothetical protein
MIMKEAKKSRDQYSIITESLPIKKGYKKKWR